MAEVEMQLTSWILPGCNSVCNDKLRIPSFGQRAGRSPRSRSGKERVMRSFIWLLSHDEVNQDMVRGFGSEHGLTVQVRHLKEGLPDGDCRALLVDLDSVAPDRRALARLVKEL